MWQVEQAGELTRLVLSNKMNRSRHLPTRILGGPIEALTGLSRVDLPERLNTTLLSLGCILEMVQAMGMVGGMYISRTGKGVKTL